MRLVKFSCHVTRHHTPYFTINQQLGIIFPVHPRVVQAHFRHLTAPSPRLWYSGDALPGIRVIPGGTSHGNASKLINS